MEETGILLKMYVGREALARNGNLKATTSTEIYQGDCGQATKSPLCMAQTSQQTCGCLILIAIDVLVLCNPKNGQFPMNVAPTLLVVDN